LVLWDWRTGRRFGAFARALALVVIYQTTVMTFYRIELWKSFGAWFLSLPLS